MNIYGTCTFHSNFCFNPMILASTDSIWKHRSNLYSQPLKYAINTSYVASSILNSKIILKNKYTFNFGSDAEQGSLVLVQVTGVREDAHYPRLKDNSPRINRSL